MIFTNCFSQNWSTIGIGVENTSIDYTCVYSMIEFNGELYIGGCFTSVNGVPASYVAKFNGLNWSAVGNGLWYTGNSAGSFSGVRCMTVYNGELYAGGIIDQSGTTSLSNVAKWNGSEWIGVGNFISGYDGVLSLCVYNNELYAAGHIFLGGYNSIAKWNGTGWINLGSGITSNNGASIGIVRDMKVYNNLLYIGGSFNEGDGISSENLITWNGTNFISIGSGVNGYYGIMKLGFFQNKLIATGGFVDVNGIPFNNIAAFDGSIWTGFDSGVGTMGTDSSGTFDVQQVLEYNNKLIVGGFFTIAGSTPANAIALWNGSSWHAMGAGVDQYVSSFIEFNGSVYVGGHFSNAGGIFVNNVAKWTESGTGIIAPIPEKSIYVFPNPIESNVTVVSSNAIKKIIISNLDGQTIEEEVNLDKSEKVQLDLSSLAKGIYFLDCITETGSQKIRVVKM